MGGRDTQMKDAMYALKNVAECLDVFGVDMLRENAVESGLNTSSGSRRQWTHADATFVTSAGSSSHGLGSLQASSGSPFSMCIFRFAIL